MDKLSIFCKNMLPLMKFDEITLQIEEKQVKQSWKIAIWNDVEIIVQSSISSLSLFHSLSFFRVTGWKDKSEKTKQAQRQFCLEESSNK